MIKPAADGHEAEGVAATVSSAPPQVAVPLEFRQVYAEDAAFVWRSLRRLGVRERDLDDVCQEVFVIVHRKLASYDGTSTVRSWLFGIARRVAADHRKRAHVRRETLASGPELEARPAAGSDEPGERELAQARAVLDEILDELDEAKRAVFVLFELEEMAMADVARAVDCPLQTAYSRLAAARKQVESAVRRRQLRGAVP